MLSRRSFLQSLAVAPVLPVVLAQACGGGKRSSGAAYLYALTDIVKNIAESEPDSLGNASNLFAHTIVSRNRCFVHTRHPSLSLFMNARNSGLPPVFIPLLSREMAETIREGDALLTTENDEFTEKARSAGARIAGLTSPAVADDYKNHSHMFRQAVRLDSVTDILVHTHLPLWDGLVALDVPTGILPGSGPVLMAAAAAVAGEAYARSGGIGQTGDTPPARALSFIETLVERLVRIEDSFDIVRKAGELAAERIMYGGRLWVLDSNGGLTKELEIIAGVPLFARALSREDSGAGVIKPGDAVIVGSLLSNDPRAMSILRPIKSITDTVIVICPWDDTGGYRLFKNVAAAIDNESHEKDGIQTFDHGTKRYLRTGGILNAAILWAVLGETTDRLIAEGFIPSFLMGAHLVDSALHNADARSRAKELGF